jgi:hypothetical protein
MGEIGEKERGKERRSARKEEKQSLVLFGFFSFLFLLL